MPIHPDKRALYPADWQSVSLRVKEGAGWVCQGSPRYPACRAAHGQPHPVTGSLVVLTVAHLDHDPRNVRPDNLRAWCQRCHNTYDAPQRAINRARRLREVAQ